MSSCQRSPVQMKGPTVQHVGLLACTALFPSADHSLGKEEGGGREEEGEEEERRRGRRRRRRGRRRRGGGGGGGS